MRADRRRDHREGGHGSQAFWGSKNGDFALTEACPSLWLCQGGGEEDGAAAGKIETAMVQWHGR